MFLHRETQNTRVTRFPTGPDTKKSTLSQQPLFRRMSVIFLLLLIAIGSLLILINPHNLSHVPGPMSETRSIWTPTHTAADSHIVWVRPTRGQVVHDSVHFEASISLPREDTFKLDHIIFTAWWTGVNPHSWINICSVSSPTRHTTFACDGNLRQLQAPSGTLLVSFDMYDTRGHVRLAPDGGFPVTYSSLSVKGN